MEVKTRCSCMEIWDGEMHRWLIIGLVLLVFLSLSPPQRILFSGVGGLLFRAIIFPFCSLILHLSIFGRSLCIYTIALALRGMN